MLTSSCVLVLVLQYLTHSASALSCYQCSSTFPGSSVCLPPCSQTDRPGSNCLLTRNVSLEPNQVGSLRAAHIENEPIISTAPEKLFLFGEEVVYLNPSTSVGWDWEYGPITYGCDYAGCNNPEDVNRLPNALNIRIPNSTLNQWLTGDLTNDCYQCDTCLDPDVTDTNMAACSTIRCPNHACNFVATRDSPSSIAACGNNKWHFSSGCILSREYAQVDMTLIYYIRSKTTFLYQMGAVCLNNNCNNITTFQQLKNAVTADPDLSCLVDPTTSTGSVTTSRTSSAATSSTTSSITAGPTTQSVTTGRTTSSVTTGRTTSSVTTGRTTSSGSTGSTTTETDPPGPSGSAQQFSMNMKLNILLIISLYLIKF